ncbi:MAG: acyl carrier protein [Desulfatitalea sp.]|nr:acyl carrier protein [Desulfatitalea sp.]
MSDQKNRIRKYIIESFLFGNSEDLNDETSFLEEGIIDSTGVLEIVAFLEEGFGLKIDDDELIPENLDSISNISAFVQRKLDSDVVRAQAQ